MILLEGQQRSPEWLAAKCARISGTRFSDAMAAEGTKTNDDLIAELAWEIAFGCNDEKRFVNEAMQHGIDTEDEAFAWYSFQSELPCRTVMFVIHGELDYVGVSPDLLVGTNGMAQIKCPQPKTYCSTIKHHVLPSQYRHQVQGEMWVCEREWSDFVTYHPRPGGLVLRVERDDALIQKIKAACERTYAAAQELATKLTRTA